MRVTYLPALGYRDIYGAIFPAIDEDVARLHDRNEAIVVTKELIR